jgi:hypothetical protein
MQAGDMSRVGLKRDIDVPLQGIAESHANAVLLLRRKRYSSGDDDLFFSLRFIQELRKGFGNVRQKADAVLSNELTKKILSDRRATEAISQFEQHTEFILFGKRR